MLKKSIVALLIAILFSPALADKYAGEFLYLGVGGRPLAMGGAYTAADGDVFSSYYNPAGLVDLDGYQAAFMHSETFGSLLNHDYFTVARKQSGGVASVSLYYLGGGGILVTEEYLGRFRVLEEESHADYVLSFAYGRNQSERLDWGLAAKVIRRDIASYSAWGLGLDAGIRYRVFEGFTSALAVQDLTGTLLSYSNDNKETVSPTAKTGIGYVRESGDFRGTLLADIDWRFEGREDAANFNIGSISGDYHIGFEVLYKQVVAARVGSDIGNLTTGIGVTFGRFTVDLALFDHDELDTSYRGSLIIDW